MDDSKKQIETLNLEELLINDSYIIPIYQRNYAWGNNEIEALLTDMIKAYQRDVHAYYIGSLVVYKRKNGQLEVIDGQQRLTTLTLIKVFLKHQLKQENILKDHLKIEFPEESNITFEHRKESDNALRNLDKIDELPQNFKEAIQSVKKNWNILIPKEDITNFTEFMLKKVQIIRTEVPAGTDLNHYFEIMNTRGEQLEKHEILKTRMMSKLQKENADSDIQSTFSCIWDACSDMHRYMVMGFDKNIRDKIFGSDWKALPKDFDMIVSHIKETHNSAKQSNQIKEELGTPNNTEQDNQEKLIPTISNILQNSNKFTEKTENEKNKAERFNSVIDFPNFLLHVLRIFQEDQENPSSLDKIKSISLDDKNLLEFFDMEKFFYDDIKKFAIVLLQCRSLFDRYVIKSDTSKEQDDHWTLSLIQPNNNTSSYQYNNSFGDTLEQKNIVMLLSMFHVSYPARTYKNWLYAVLRKIYKDNNISATQYIEFLEKLSDIYYFGHYGDNIDFFELIISDDYNIKATQAHEDVLNSGTSIPNFIFNRLDYLLWKNKDKSIKDKYINDFRFTFRSSVEHFYPQTPIDGSKPPNEIHNFGNLCLISSSMNSKFSNNVPKAKVANFENEKDLSLKLRLMMEKTKNKNHSWHTEEILEHGKEMLAKLNNSKN